MIASGIDEDCKNIDKNIASARNSLFAMLGPAFSYRCKLSPTLQTHLWRLYIKPVLISGLSSLPVRPANLSALTTFHHKLLRGFLKLSPYSPTAPLYFLLGELPMEATLHLGVLALFWNIWSNPHTTIHKIVKYVLIMSGDSSVTWSVHLRILGSMYGLPNPLSLMEGPLWPKQSWKDLCLSKVTIYHERKLRAKAATNFKLSFLNIQTIGLSGRSHPALHNLLTTQVVRIARPHLKMLSGDYMCYYFLWKDRGSDPQCRLCPSSQYLPETITNILMLCRGTHETRSRLWPELLNTISTTFPQNKILAGDVAPDTAAQFILDCTSLNLPNGLRINISHPRTHEIFRTARQYCYAVHSDRVKQLKELNLVK